MTKKELEKFKQLLLELRSKLLKEWEGFERENIGQSFKDQVGQISTSPTHPADMSSITDEQERVFLLATHERKILEAVEESLMRIANGTYGICPQCGAEIPKSRLEAVPYAVYCIKCQEKIEESEETIPTQFPLNSYF